jgi:hypothetical protein
MNGIDYLHHKIEEYLTLKKEATANIYRSALRTFVRHYKSEHGEDKTISHFLDKIFDEYKKPRREQSRIAEIEVSNFIRFLKKKGLAPNTILLKFAAIQNFLKYKQVIVSSSFIGVFLLGIQKKRIGNMSGQFRISENL